MTEREREREGEKGHFIFIHSTHRRENKPKREKKKNPSFLPGLFPLSLIHSLVSFFLFLFRCITHYYFAKRKEEIVQNTRNYICYILVPSSFSVAVDQLSLKEERRDDND